MATIISAKEIAGLRDAKAFERARTRISEAVKIILAQDSTAKRCFRAGKSNTHPEATVEGAKEALQKGFASKEEEFHTFGNTVRKIGRLFRKDPSRK